MTDRPMYHDESRKLQDQFDTRRLADRLNEKLAHTRFSDDDRQFIAQQRMFFLATTDADGFPDCSFKGGDPGFVRILDGQSFVFPSFDGNGMFKSLGNIRANSPVGLLFIDFQLQKRLRVNGLATASNDDPLMADFPGAQLIVRVAVQKIFPNCGRYIPLMQLVERSPYIPVAGQIPPTPAWKTRPEFQEVLPAAVSPRDDKKKP